MGTVDAASQAERRGRLGPLATPPRPAKPLPPIPQPSTETLVADETRPAVVVAAVSPPDSSAPHMGPMQSIAGPATAAAASRAWSVSPSLASSGSLGWPSIAGHPQSPGRAARGPSDAHSSVSAPSAVGRLGRHPHDLRHDNDRAARGRHRHDAQHHHSQDQHKQHYHHQQHHHHSWQHPFHAHSDGTNQIVFAGSIISVSAYKDKHPISRWFHTPAKANRCGMWTRKTPIHLEIGTALISEYVLLGDGLRGHLIYAMPTRDAAFALIQTARGKRCRFLLKNIAAADEPPRVFEELNLWVLQLRDARHVLESAAAPTKLAHSAAGSASEHTAPAIHNSIAPKHDQVIDHEPQPPSSALQDLIDWHSGGDHDEVPDVAATEKHDSTANRLVEMQSDTLAWIDSADLSGATSPPAALRPASSHEELTALSPRHQAAASETVLDAHAWMVGDEVDEADQHADPDADGKDADANPARSDDAARSMTAALRTSSLPNLRSTQMQMRSAWCDARVSVCRTRESHARLALLQARAASLQEELRMLAKRVG